MLTKKCTKCGEVKNLDEFSKRNKGNVGTWCKKCSAKQQADHYALNAERINLRRTARKLARKARDKGFDITVTFEGVTL